MKRRLPWHRSDANLAAMFLNDVVCDVQAQAGADAGRFRRKERVENARLNFRWNARTIVRDFDDDAFFILTKCFDFDFARAVHRVNRVVENVRPDLVQFTAVRFDARQIARVLARNRNALLKFTPQND